MRDRIADRHPRVEQSFSAQVQYGAVHHLLIVSQSSINYLQISVAWVVILVSIQSCKSPLLVGYRLAELLHVEVYPHASNVFEDITSTTSTSVILGTASSIKIRVRKENT